MSIISAGTSNTSTLVYTGDTTGAMVFQTNGTTEAMRIDTNQNVGIGTSSPSSYGPNGSMLALAKTASGTETNLSIINNSSTNYQGAGILLGNLAASANTGATYLYHHKFTTGSDAYAFNISQRKTDGTYISNIWNVDYLNNVHAFYRPNTGVQVMGLDANGNLQFNSGYGSVATAFGVRAWVYFNTSGSILGSGNVSSVSKNATGNYTANFTNALPNANYSAVATADIGGWNTGATQTGGYNTTSISIQSRNLSMVATDASVSVVIVR